VKREPVRADDKIDPDELRKFGLDEDEIAYYSGRKTNVGIGIVAVISLLVFLVITGLAGWGIYELVWHLTYTYTHN
jgi:hypothetical protein